MNPNVAGVAGETGDAAGAGAQPQDNNAVQPAPLPIQPEANIPGPNEQAGPANDNEQNVGVRQAGVVLPDLGLQALYVNPPLPMLDLDTEDEVVPPISPIIVPREQIDREFRISSDKLDMVELGPVNAALDMPVIGGAQDESSTDEVPALVEDPKLLAPLERPGVAAPAEQPRVAVPVKQPEVADDTSNDSIVGELSSMSSATTSSTETSTTETSDEDNIPLIPFYSPSSGNGPTVPMIYVPGRYPPGVEPVRPVARREDLPQPSRPILIPPTNRSQPPDDDDDSSSPEMAPTRSKRRRPDRPH